MVIEESSKYDGMTPWLFHAECSELWWNRILDYPQMIKKRHGKLPDWVFIKLEAERRRIPPWDFEKECSELWWDRMVLWHNAQAAHRRKMVKRQKNFNEIRKAKG